MASQTLALGETADIADRHPSLGQTLREWPVLILLGSIIVFFARPLSLGQTFFYRDLMLFYFPQRIRLIELIRTSGLPLWNPFVHGGQPFLANVDSMAFYPTWLLYFVLPPVAAFNLEIVLHFLLCALAAYWLARRVGLSPIPSLISGAVFTFCGFTLSLGNFLNHLLALPNTAFLILFWHRFLEEKKTRWFLGAVASGTLVVFAGSMEFLSLTMAVALGWALVQPASDSFPRLQRIACWIGLGLAIVSISAVQIWPQLQVIKQSTRGSGFDFLGVTSHSLNPRRLAEFLVPEFLGPTDTLEEEDYWGWRLEDGGFPYILSIYFGLPVFALAFLAVVSREKEKQRVRFRRFLLGVVGASIVLALGRFLLVRPFLYRVIPFSAMFRYPIKALAAAVLPMALLAGSGAQELARRDPEGSIHWLARLIWVAAGLFGALSLWLACSSSALATFGHFFFLGDVPASGRSRILLALLHTTITSFFLALLVATRRVRLWPWMPAALAGLVVLDLGVAGRDVNTYAPRALFKNEPALAGEIRRNLAGGRFFRDETPARATLRVPSNKILWRHVWRRQTLDSFLASGLEIPVIFHQDYDGLAQRRLVRLTTLIKKLPWEKRLPLVSIGNVTVILTPERLSLPALQPLAEIPNPSDVRFFLYRNLAAAPRVGFVTSFVFADSETDALKGILSRGFDPRRHVVLEGPRTSPAGPGCSTASIVEMESGVHSWTGRVTAVCGGYLVFSEPFYEGWRAMVDGASRPILRANLAFSAIQVPPGTHVVRRVYRPTSVVIGTAISALSGTLLVLLALAVRGKPSRIPATGES